MKNAKRILILLSIISIAAFIVTSVAQTISGDVKLGNGVIFAIIGIVILSWVIASFSKHRISFTRIYLILLFSFLFILTTAAYLDINSPADIKNSVTKALTTGKGEFRSRIDLVVQRAELKFVEVTEVVQDNLEESSTEPTQGSKPSDATSKKPTEKTDTTEYVRIGGGILVGADGHCITLKNNPDAKNPSWAELKTFLLKDDTDSIEYDFDKFVCADFAERLHNNGEAASIRVAFVSIWLGPCSYWPTSGGHALNAFETTDKGLVFIDCTGFVSSINADKIVDVEVGKNYIPRSIFPEPGWSDVWDSMGKVERIETIQW